jgi:hypothetical protein
MKAFWPRLMLVMVPVPEVVPFSSQWISMPSRDS